MGGNRAPKQKGRRESGWFSRSTMAAVFDVSGWSFDQHIRPLVPANAIRGEGRDLRFYASATVQEWACRRFGPAPDLESGAGDGDGLLAGSDSPELERWRRARADMAELDLAERRGDLVDRHKFEGLLNRTSAILRGAGEALQRNYGPEAQGLLDEALDDVDAEIVRHFARYEPDDVTR